jgi:hypothetical protein
MRLLIPRESRCDIWLVVQVSACVCVPLLKPDSCSSPRYGQHLDVDQIANIVQAPESEIAAVTSWLRANNIPHKISATRHIVEAEAPVAAVEALLNCELYVFTNKLEPERSLVRKVGAMYLPHGVANVVSGVFNVAGDCSQSFKTAVTALSPSLPPQILLCPARALSPASPTPPPPPTCRNPRRKANQLCYPANLRGLQSGSWCRSQA